MKEIIVNVDNYNENSIKTIEGDNLSEVYKICICKNKRRIDLTNKIAIMAYVNEYRNKKSNILALNITNASQGEIELPITNVISSENGVYACQIAIYGENNSLEQTAPFSLIVENNIFSKISNTAINSTDFHILSEAIKTTNSYAEKLKQGTENIELQYAKKLNEKMNKDDVLSMANMGQDIKEAMTGGSVAIVGKNAVGTINILNKSVIPEKTNFIEKGVNLFNKYGNFENGYFYLNGIFNPNELYRTCYIDIEPNTTYTTNIREGYNIVFFDSTGKLIEGLNIESGWSYKFKTPDNINIKTMSFTISKKMLEDDIMLIKSEKLPDKYIQFEYILSDKIKLHEDVKHELLSHKTTEGKKMLVFGDSITETATISEDGLSYKEGTRSNWLKYSKDYLKLGEVKNYARSGASYKDQNIVGDRRKSISEQINMAIANGFKPDLIVISAGTNDNDGGLVGNYDTAIKKENLENLERNNFYEALRWSFLKIRTNYPDAICFACTPTQRASTEQPPALIEAIIKMAKRYNFIIIDNLNESGIIKDFEVNGGEGRDLYDGLHPKESGQIKISENINRTILNYLNS